MRTAKTLIRLGGCPGWSESLLGAHTTLLVLSWDVSNYIHFLCLLCTCTIKSIVEENVRFLLILSIRNMDVFKNMYIQRLVVPCLSCLCLVCLLSLLKLYLLCEYFSIMYMFRTVWVFRPYAEMKRKQCQQCFSLISSRTCEFSVQYMEISYVFLRNMENQWKILYRLVLTHKLVLNNKHYAHLLFTPFASINSIWSAYTKKKKKKGARPHVYGRPV